MACTAFKDIFYRTNCSCMTTLVMWWIAAHIRKSRLVGLISQKLLEVSEAPFRFRMEIATRRTRMKSQLVGSKVEGIRFVNGELSWQAIFCTARSSAKLIIIYKWVSTGTGRYICCWQYCGSGSFWSDPAERLGLDPVPDPMLLKITYFHSFLMLKSSMNT
jgi:hypothetical protein